jgi:hypothetical protein
MQPTRRGRRRRASPPRVIPLPDRRTGRSRNDPAGRGIWPGSGRTGQTILGVVAAEVQAGAGAEPEARPRARPPYRNRRSMHVERRRRVPSDLRSPTSGPPSRFRPRPGCSSTPGHGPCVYSCNKVTNLCPSESTAVSSPHDPTGQHRGPNRCHQSGEDSRAQSSEHG